MLKERNVLNEVLLRFNSDGTLKGAHQRWESHIYDDETDEIKASSLDFAKPLDQAAIAGLMNIKVADMANEIIDKNNRLKEVDSEIALAWAEVEAAKQETERMKAAYENERKVRLKAEARLKERG